MVQITPAFYVLCAQGWGYLFARWPLSLALVVALALVDFLLVSGTDFAREVWLYRFVPGLVAWAAGAIFSEWVYRAQGISFRDSAHGEFYPVAFGFEALFYTLLVLPIAGTHNVLNTVLVGATGFVFLWIAHAFSKLRWRFKDDHVALAYYFLYWLPLLAVTLLPLLIGAVLLDPVRQNSAWHFVAACVAATASFAFMLFTEAYMRQQQRMPPYPMPA